MVLLHRRDVVNRRKSKNKILATILTGVVFLIVPILFIILDPIQMIVNYKLRLAKGTILYNIMLHEIPSTRFNIYVFNYTNADRFLSGEDYKLKVEEVGPFVYQEYRWQEDLEFSEDGKYMEMTPRLRSEFIPEASIGDPKDVIITVANLPFLSSIALLSNYPGFVQYAFSVFAAQIGTKPIINIDVHSFLWGYKNPLITICNSLVPGLIHFDNFGLLDRLYENESDYRVVVAATNEERFKIKLLKKYTHVLTDSINQTEERNITFEEDTYEGAAYPPMLTPDVPISLYRLGICRPWPLDYIGTRIMEYGGEGLVYTISNKTFLNNFNPITKKPYAEGLVDISYCFYNLPFVVHKAHYLDCDPKLTERIEGLKPDRENMINEIVIDRKAAITYSTRLSMQSSMVLGDMSFNSQTKMMTDSVMPVAHIDLEQPKMTEGTMRNFVLVYRIAPLVMICLEIVSVTIGLALLGHTFRMLYLNWMSRTRPLVFQTSINEKLINY